jgi:hypothetical protein
VNAGAAVWLSTCLKGKIMSKTLSLVDVLQRSLAQNKEDITPLLGYLVPPRKN